MIIKPAQLGASLAKALLPLYWIAGDEPLLKQEAADQIRSHCRSAGFSDREVFDVDRSFDWQRFSQATGNLSLFGDRKLLELRLGSTSLDEAGKQALENYVATAGNDQVLLITGPRLESATLKTKWFKPLEAAGVLVQIWPLSSNELPGWLEARLRSLGIRASADAIQLLVDRVEGNLLAAVQEMEKLRLLVRDGGQIELDAAMVAQLVADSSRYTAFALVDATLAGDGRRSLRILQSLRSEGVHPLPIIGAFNNELMRLLPLLERVAQGEPAGDVARSPQVIFSRRQVVGTALRRLDAKKVWQQFHALRRADQASKGLGTSDPWDTLAGMVLSLAGQLPPELDNLFNPPRGRP